MHVPVSVYIDQPHGSELLIVGWGIIGLPFEVF